ncbi:MAG TPA: indole-3-glycerol-phosphate synthase, partial [Nitrososphaeraceae archaeon]|nr:indole-3-glycerol-phosphate synthase [Nitrososphaeraceae archaeon]
RKVILTCTHVPIISEIKFSSPSKGKILDQSKINPKDLAIQMTNSGSVGISVLTQPYLFDGSIDNLASIRKSVSVPLLMKDIIVSEAQVDAARKIGADCILLIKAVFDKGFAEGSLEKFTDYAIKKGLEVITEVHSEDEFKDVLKNNKRHLIGINNRNLSTLEVDINVTIELLQKLDKQNNIVISESGISKSDEIKKLRSIGVDAFLVGTSIMESGNVFEKIKELSHA